MRVPPRALFGRADRLPKVEAANAVRPTTRAASPRRTLRAPLPRPCVGSGSPRCTRACRQSRPDHAPGRLPRAPPGGVEELREDRAIVGVASIGQPGEAGTAVVPTSLEKQLGKAVGRMEGHALQDDRPGTAPGPRLVAGDRLVGKLAITTQRRAVRRREHAVLHRRAVDHDSAEEVWKTRHAGCPDVRITSVYRKK